LSIGVWKSLGKTRKGNKVHGAEGLKEVRRETGREKEGGGREKGGRRGEKEGEGRLRVLMVTCWTAMSDRARCRNCDVGRRYRKSGVDSLEINPVSLVAAVAVPLVRQDILDRRGPH
jgi:hypothetical protein